MTTESNSETSNPQGEMPEETEAQVEKKQPKTRRTRSNARTSKTKKTSQGENESPASDVSAESENKEPISTEETEPKKKRTTKPRSPRTKKAVSKEELPQAEAMKEESPKEKTPVEMIPSAEGGEAAPVKKPRSRGTRGRGRKQAETEKEIAEAPESQEVAEIKATTESEKVVQPLTISEEKTMASEVVEKQETSAEVETPAKKRPAARRPRKRGPRKEKVEEENVPVAPVISQESVLSKIETSETRIAEVLPEVKPVVPIEAESPVTPVVVEPERESVRSNAGPVTEQLPTATPVSEQAVTEPVTEGAPLGEAKAEEKPEEEMPEVKMRPPSNHGRRGRRYPRNRGKGPKPPVEEKIPQEEQTLEAVAETPKSTVKEIPTEEALQVRETGEKQPETLAPAQPTAPTKEGRGQRGRNGRGKRATVSVEAESHKNHVAANKEIVVNVEPRETRIALIENQKLMELRIERDERVVGSIYKGKVANVLPGMDAAFVDIGLERNSFLYVGDILPEIGDAVIARHRRDSRSLKIKDMVKVGQEILVQVVKAPRGTKGARVSTRVSLPGRYVVLMPESETLGISRKIEDSSERERLKKIGEHIRPKNFGVIIRTEAEGQGEVELRQDVEFIQKLWEQIQETANVTPAPGLVHQDLSIIFKTIRDVFSEDVSKLLIDSPEDYEKACELVHYISPKLESRLVLYQDPEPIFERYAVETEIERLLRPKVWLKSGGFLAIDQTEALTTVDVNTGKFIGSTSLSETILRTNLDAVTELTRQLRLRDIGGIIIIDFIDMASPKDRNMVVSALEKALKADRTRTKIAHLSPLGLIEMTRKRTGETVSEVLTDACPYCGGRGRIFSTETTAIQIERELRRVCGESDDEALLVWAHPEVAAQLIGAGGEIVERLERELRRAIYIRADELLHREKYRVIPGDLQEFNRRLLPYRGGQIIEGLVEESGIITAPHSIAWSDGYFIDVVNGGEHPGERVKIRLSQTSRSFAFGEVVKPTRVLDKSGLV